MAILTSLSAQVAALEAERDALKQYENQRLKSMMSAADRERDAAIARAEKAEEASEAWRKQANEQEQRALKAERKLAERYAVAHNEIERKLGAERDKYKAAFEAMCSACGFSAPHEGPDEFDREVKTRVDLARENREFLQKHVEELTKLAGDNAFEVGRQRADKMAIEFEAEKLRATVEVLQRGDAFKIENETLRKQVKQYFDDNTRLGADLHASKKRVEELTAERDGEIANHSVCETKLRQAEKQIAENPYANGSVIEKWRHDQIVKTLEKYATAESVNRLILDLEKEMQLNGHLKDEIAQWSNRIDTERRAHAETKAKLQCAEGDRDEYKKRYEHLEWIARKPGVNERIGRVLDEHSAKILSWGENFINGDSRFFAHWSGCDAPAVYRAVDAIVKAAK